MLLDFLDVLAGTGCRPGEVLALRWEDVDLTAGTIRVTGTLVPVAGGLERQAPKTATSARWFRVPAFVVQVLRLRRLRTGTAEGPVFATSKGTWIRDSNMRRLWRSAHGIAAAGYRAAHGLGISRPLVAETVSQRMRDSWETHREAHLTALEQTRDPDTARRSSPARRPARAEVRAGYLARGRARRGRDLTPEETATLGDGLDLAAWADAARTLLALEGVTATSIAAASGIAVPTVHQRLRRYPAT